MPRPPRVPAGNGLVGTGGDREQSDRVPLAGLADHFVSEAIYLRDPDQNGIELYRDRPQEEWPRTPEGEFTMFTRPLDVQALLDENPDA